MLNHAHTYIMRCAKMTSDECARLTAVHMPRMSSDDSDHSAKGIRVQAELLAASGQMVVQ